MRFAKLREIRRNTLEIRPVSPGNYEKMRHAYYFECRVGEIAHLDRMVNELVVVFRSV